MKYKAFIIESDLYKDTVHEWQRGWGNGYVAIPPESGLHGLDYSDSKFYDIEVNGDLTYSGKASEWKKDVLKENDIPSDYWIVGFDTAHSWDTLDRWPKESVQFEADNLLKQIEVLAND